MSGTVNIVILAGHLGQDAIARTLPSGTEVVNFSIATTTTWKDKDTQTKKDKTEWTRISYFGRGADAVAPYLKKGALVHVQGRLETRTWEDKTGAKRTTTEVRADRVTLLGGGKGRAKREEADESGDQRREAPEAPAYAEDDEIIPF